MNRKFIASLTVSVAFGAASACAAVSFTNVTTAASSAWDLAFGGGNRVIAPTLTGSVNNEVTSTGGFVQSFTGNGQVLEGFGIHSSGSGASGTWTIALIDYGVAAPVRNSTAFNSVTGTVFAETFTNISFGSERHLYFDFSSGSNILLQANHQYGITIFASGGTGSVFINRGGDDYANGAMQLGAVGSFTGSFAGGVRTSNFAVYTAVAAIPEPSSYAAILGLAAAGLALSRRRKP